MATNFASYSQMGTHRACPQQWNYSTIRKLKRDDPLDVRVELEFGNWWHAIRAADSIERGRWHESLKRIPEELQTTDDGPRIRTDATDLVDRVMEKAHQWWDGMDADVAEVWMNRIGGDLPSRLKYVNEQWYDQWGEDIEYEHPLAVEFRWRRELPTLSDPDTGEEADPDTAMVGYVDEIYWDSRRKIVVARDHKAHKTLGTQSSADDMMDSQLQVYSWGASPEVTSWGMGSIQAVAYDRIKMVAPRPPSLTSSGKLASRNGEPSISASDLRTYLEWSAGPDGEGVVWKGAMLPKTAAEKEAEKNGETVERRYKEGGVYTTDPAIVERLSDPAARSAWFQRSLTPLNRNIVVGHLRAAVDTAFDMTRSRRRVEESGEAGRNLTSRCKWCPFVELCRAELAGGPGGEYDLTAYNLRQGK